MSTAQLDAPQIEGMDVPGKNVRVGESPQDELHQALYYTDSWIEVVRVLRDTVGLSQAEIARGADVSPATVARWLESPTEAVIRAYGRLDDLRYVVLWLARCGFEPRLISFWLAAKNVDLATDPLSAIAQGRFLQVIHEANDFAAGRPPIR